MLYEVNQDALRYEMEHLGVYKPSVAIMLGKGKITPLKVLHVRTPAANIIKQEMLAAGGDCATPGTTITCAVPHVDILLLGNAKHYKTLVYKLKQMPYFGIPDIVADLETYLAAVPKCTKLADGRLLHYDSVKVMGIINVTPDSFYAGSRKKSVDAVLEQVEQMLSYWISVENPPGPAAIRLPRRKNGIGCCLRWRKLKRDFRKVLCL